MHYSHAVGLPLLSLSHLAHLNWSCWSFTTSPSHLHSEVLGSGAVMSTVRPPQSTTRLLRPKFPDHTRECAFVDLYATWSAMV
jgi:hypothetical protein